MGICDRAWKYYFTCSLKDNDEGEAPVGEEDGKEMKVFKNHFLSY